MMDNNEEVDFAGEAEEEQPVDSVEDQADKFNKCVEQLGDHHLSVSWGDRLLTLDKSAGFFENEAFCKALDAIRGSHTYDQYNGPDSIAWRLNTLCWAANCGLAVGGSFVECGIFKGDMAWVVAQAIGDAKLPPFYLYDSFDGFSDRYSSPDDYPLNPRFLEYANGFYREPGLYEYVKARFAGQSQVIVTKGFLPEALDEICPDTIGFLHVDLNSPKAEVLVLERLFDKVLPGGVVVFDDYGWKLFSEQKDAEDAFMAARGYQILELPTGQGLVVKR